MPVTRSKPYLLHDLGRFLVDQRTAGRLALLVVDEAQNLNTSALEELRMISNLETEKSKLIQILLVGQPSLRDLLAVPALEQLRQRVTVNYHLQSLDSRRDRRLHQSSPAPGGPRRADRILPCRDRSDPSP